MHAEERPPLPLPAPPGSRARALLTRQRPSPAEVQRQVERCFPITAERRRG